jgi:hypothetical protein
VIDATAVELEGGDAKAIRRDFQLPRSHLLERNHRRGPIGLL